MPGRGSDLWSPASCRCIKWLHWSQVFCKCSLQHPLAPFPCLGNGSIGVALSGGDAVPSKPATRRQRWPDLWHVMKRAYPLQPPRLLRRPMLSNSRTTTKMWSLWSIVALVVAVAIPVGVGFLGNVAGGGGADDWYRNLNKPSWTPPDLVFPFMWTTLYILMGVSSWLVWKEGGFSGQAYPLGAYIFQLVLNFIWSPLFFGLHRVGHALVEIVILWLAIAVTIYLFFPVNAIAAYLLVPYIAWVTVATALNGYIWKYNGEIGSDVTQPLQSS